MENKYVYNDNCCQWERVDRVQEYKGHKIETITSHGDYTNAPRHREYRVTFLDGHTAYFPINKREGGNIKDLKIYLDFKSRH